LATDNINELYRLLVEGAKDYAIFALDPEGRVLTWNEGARRMKGYEAFEIIGQHMSVFYPPDALERNWPQQELAITSVQGRFEDEGWRVRKDGTRFWANVIISALHGEDGRLLGFSKITRDLTERRRQEESLRNSDERFRLLVEGVKDYAIFMLGPDGRVASWNAGAERIKGYAAHEIIGRHFSTFYTAESIARGWPEHELRVAAEVGRFEDEGLRVRKDGSTFVANVVITALYDRANRLRGYAKVTRDVSERKRVELLETGEKRTQEFLAMLAHELRNPLAPIAASLQVLLKNPSYDAEGELARRVIQRQLGQLTRVVDDLLDVSRVTQAAIQLRRRAIDLSATVREAAESARHWIDTHGHELDVRVPAGEVLVEADEERLTQVLTNLLHNAAKYTPRGGRITISLSVSDGEAVISVKDTGIGISPDLLETVFDLFVQGQQSLARTEGGLGVGLTLVKRLVNLHGGTVEAHSGGAGQGSEFIVRLPARPVPDSALARTPERQAGRGASRRVLVVDDNADAADMLAILLKEFGHDVRAASDGPSALSVARDFVPQVVLLDIGLPGMNGYEVAQRMRRLPGLEDAVYIAVTGYGQPSDRAESERAGICHHLVKPVDAGELQNLIAAETARSG
jgi:PAS domain S-box-containing protein